MRKRRHRRQSGGKTDYTTGTPWPDIDLDGVVTKDTPADLKDNFALAVNKDKILATEIPEGYSFGGTIMDVVLKNDEDLKNMFLNSKAESHDAKLALTLFELMMDWDSRNEVGVTPLKEQIDEVEALDSIDALTSYLGETPEEEQLYPLWIAGMTEDLDDSSKYVLIVEPGALLLDDSAEYKTLTDYGKIKKEARTELVGKILVKLGYTEEEAAAKIDNCISFETELAGSICTNEEDKARISAMIDEIIEAYHGIIEGADFLSDATRKNAMGKLDSMGKNVLYPDSWEKYSYEELNLAAPEDGGTLWEAMQQISAFKTASDVKDYPDPVDKEKWGQPPHIINCFYYPQQNSIYIMGAFAQVGIYNSDMSDEELYAKLGTVIGHEISHAFDSSGAQFDKNGNMVNWWEEEDQKAFRKKNEKMVAYYNAIHPWEGQDLYGSIMTGEACADMAGMKCMLKIAADKENFDYDKFFRSYADLWLTKDSLGRQYKLVNDTHPMNYLRINATLQQYDEFLDYYGITEGDNMYLAPEDRVAIW